MPESPSRRQLLRRLAAFGLVIIAASVTGFPVLHAEPAAEFRVGWQKGGSLGIVRARGTLVQRLASQGVQVKWFEFAAGPQMLEALNAGSIDFAVTGETPPIFAQAAGAELVYVGNEPPAPFAERFLVPKTSTLQSIADLKGKRVSLNKGSNVHYLLVKGLQQAGLHYSDITPIYLAPAEARAAFESGSIDAWVIWEPYAAAAEAQIGARTLADGQGLVDNHIFYLATRRFAERHPQVLQETLAEIKATGQWINNNLKEAAAVIAPQIGLPESIAAVALSRYSFDVAALQESVVRRQQEIANVFYDLKLVPKKLDIASVIWKSPETQPAAVAGTEQK